MSFHVARSAAVVGSIGLCLALAGCGRKPVAHNAGWLRVVVDTTYNGEPVHFVAYTECIAKRVPGGSYGATPATGTISQRPKSVGKVMPDGSFVGFQMPELCGKYFETRAPWEFTPTPFVPFMVWSDRKQRPTQMEAYLGEASFAAPGSKLGRSAGIATPLRSVDEAVAAATRALPNVVLQDSHLISDVDEIGYGSTERGFRASFGWPEAGEAGDADRLDCVNKFRSGQLVPDREIHPHVTLAQCKDALASVTPFLWDGTQYRADPGRTGMLIFQRVDPRMNGAVSYWLGSELVAPVAAGAGPYHVTFISAPARDPNQGV